MLYLLVFTALSDAEAITLRLEVLQPSHSVSELFAPLRIVRARALRCLMHVALHRIELSATCIDSKCYSVVRAFNWKRRAVRRVLDTPNL